jgi:hypothetical protein
MIPDMRLYVPCSLLMQADCTLVYFTVPLYPRTTPILNHIPVQLVQEIPSLRSKASGVEHVIYHSYPSGTEV